MRRGARGESVKAVQGALAQLAAHLPAPELDPQGVDGVFGSHTREAVMAWQAMAERPVTGELSADGLAALMASVGICGGAPSGTTPAAEGDDQNGSASMPLLGAWFDRSGVLDPDRCRRLAAGLLDEVSLFLTGIEDYLHPFVSWTRLLDVTGDYRSDGATPWWNVWCVPARTSAQRDFWARLRAEAEIAQVGIDLDREQAAKGWTDADTERWLTIWRGFRGPVQVNDFASVQSHTARFIRALAAEGMDVRIMPQAYSVDVTRHGKTQPGSVYWPGTTQDYAMRESLWGGLPGTRCVGVAYYKQAWAGRPMTAQKSIRTQVETAQKYQPAAIWGWDGERLTGTVRKTLAEMWGR